eukprot:8547106-Pyramimonas_sp.AAC.1
MGGRDRASRHPNTVNLCIVRMRGEGARALEAHVNAFRARPASGSGRAWAEGARMQGCPWEGCPSLLCGLA